MTFAVIEKFICRFQSVNSNLKIVELVGSAPFSQIEYQATENFILLFFGCYCLDVLDDMFGHILECR